MAGGLHRPKGLQDGRLRPHDDVRTHHSPHSRGTRGCNHRLQHDPPRRLADDGRGNPQRHSACDTGNLRTRPHLHLGSCIENQDSLTLNRTRQSRRKPTAHTHPNPRFQSRHITIANRTCHDDASPSHRHRRRHALCPACAQRQHPCIKSHRHQFTQARRCRRRRRRQFN